MIFEMIQKFSFNKKLLSKVFPLFIFTLLFLQSCIEAPKTKRLSSATANSTNSNGNSSSNLPVFKDGLNYFQNGNTTYTGVFSIVADFGDSFYFRGKEVDSYIRSVNPSTPVCMIVNFSAATVNKIAILSMIPKSVYNYTNQSIEYYYTLASNDSSLNQNNCQKTILINKIFPTGSTSTPIYILKNLCPSNVCNPNGYTSEQIKIYTQSGIEVTNMTTTGMLFSVKPPKVTSTNGGSSCTSSSECKVLGYDCCSGNQCVKDLQEVPGDYKNTNEYKQALQDILNVPSKIYNYPQYYYICSLGNNSNSSNNTTSNSNQSASDAIIAQHRLDKLGSYYSCINKVVGEMGLCSTTFSNVDPSNTTSYSLPVDDRSFASTFTNNLVNIDTLTNIEKITYGDVTIYDATSSGVTDLQLALPNYTNDYVSITVNQNDDITTGTQVKLIAKPDGAISKDLVVTYRNDASCIMINSTTYKCEKYYVQGQKSYGSTLLENRRGRVMDHYPASKLFKLPTFANVGKSIQVYLDGVLLIQGTDWDLDDTKTFVEVYNNSSGSLRVQDKQTVKIVYYSTSSNVFNSKKVALEGIKSACNCSDYSCNLSPIKNANGYITDYACVYPEVNPIEPPSSQKIYLSSKSIPVRYFDRAGSPQTDPSVNSLGQEGINDGIETFSYLGNDLSKPNNLSGYIGFNEIYGSMTTSSNSAKPAKVVTVKKNSSYDIYVDNGSYYTCSQCGSDYYSQLVKLFPNTMNGGGLNPALTSSTKFPTSSSAIRGDDFRFGRACLVPATMLPWSHFPSSDVTTQRKNRMKAQHFLYANGYNHDWYGFDYGAVIGSFDGVKWFAIGTNRRIKATSNKLFLAVNGLMGDLTIDSTYTVTVNDSLLNPSGAGMVQSDLENDGAQCQKSHVCQSDKDCYASLGPDFVCSTVVETTTSWPVFDDNANELADINSSNNSFTSILGITNPGKRCMYRGRGALCTPNFNNVSLNSTFNQTKTIDFHACSPNNYCQSFSTNGSLNYNFNNRLNRYGKVVTDATRDSFGLGAPTALRPFKFNGDEQIRSETLHNFAGNKALAMCIPGRDVETQTFVGQNQSIPNFSNYLGDRTIGIGHTLAKLNSADSTYLNSCGPMDVSNNYIYRQDGALFTPAVITDPDTTGNAAGGQFISSNALYKIKTIFDAKGMTFNLLSSTPSSILSSVSVQRNSCMKAPGAACFSDFECAPSKPIADKVKLLNAQESSLATFLNPYEIKFWQENLVCSQATATTDTTFDPKNNKCCREVGSVISIGQQDSTNALNSTSLPAKDIALNDSTRYSRVSTYYNEMKTNNTDYPGLTIPTKDQCTTSCFNYSKLKNQSKTLSLIGNKTSCSDNWVRSFSNGTHNWDKDKFQSFNASTFKCYNFLPDSINYTCAGSENELDSTCKFVQTSPVSSKAKAVMKLIGQLELTGIPQIAVPAETQFISQTDSDVACRSHPIYPNNAYPISMNIDGSGVKDYYVPPTSFYSKYTSTNYNTYTVTNADKEFFDSTSGLYYYSAADTSNFYSGIKQVFRPDEIVACQPAGTTMASTADYNKCCTGFINSTTMKCALPDYVDLSIYTNRYVSSEGSSIAPTLFDEDGYIKDPSTVAILACQKNMCASKKIAFGLLVSNLKIPGLESNNTANKFYRFLQGHTNSEDTNKVLTFYNRGLKLNTHAYCVPEDVSQGSGTDLQIVSCGN